MSDEQWMREALALAREAAADGEVPVGCVVTHGERIVGRGRNRRECGKSALAHAELEAIAEACKTLGGWRLWQCALYVTLEPCPMCAGAILNAHIPRVVWGAADPKTGRSRFSGRSAAHARLLPAGGHERRAQRRMCRAAHRFFPRAAKIARGGEERNHRCVIKSPLTAPAISAGI